MPTDVLVIGALTYTYAGQAEILRDRPTSTGPQPYQLGDKASSALQDLYDTVRIDDLGRKWVVTDVDVDLACANAGLGRDVCDLDAVPEPEPFEKGLWWPQSWNSYGGDYPLVQVPLVPVDYDEYLWLADSRNYVGPHFSERQKKTVAVFFAPQGDFQSEMFDFRCSGSVIGPKTVLTAAHCVTPGMSNNELRVCTRGNMYHVAGESVCTAVTAIHVNVNFTHLSMKRWDLAVLHVHDNLQARVGAMQLSQDSDEDILEADLRHNGYPFAGAERVRNVSLNGSTDAAMNGVRLWSQAGVAIEVVPHLVKTTLDTTTGQSGGPIYTCPGVSCNEGDPAVQVSLMSGVYNPVSGTTWSGGPSIPARWTWITNHIQ